MPRPEPKKANAKRTSEAVTELEPKDLAWLVKYRNKIQKLMLRLHRNPKQPRDGLWQDYVAAAFSLWRAVFLCHAGKAESEIMLYQHAKHLLERVVETNTVSFADDRAARAWMGGYYIWNARFRLGLEDSKDPTRRRRPKYSEQVEDWENTFHALNTMMKADGIR